MHSFARCDRLCCSKQERQSNRRRDGDDQVRALKAKAKDKFYFQVVEGFALASKHCKLSSRLGFDSEKYMVAYPSYVGVMRAGQTFLGDTIGGITVQWEEREYVNLTWALKATLEYLESEFPELAVTSSSDEFGLMGDAD